MSLLNRSGYLVAGMALFSMFFGAGDLIWPLILGGQSGDQNLYAMLGLLVTGVSLPLLGVISMMLFGGNHKEFFSRLGVRSAFLIILIVQVILGPAGSIPRLFTLSYATLKPFLFEWVDLALFSIIASMVVLAFTVRPQKLVNILGMVLTPFLLVSLCAIIAVGLFYAGEPEVAAFAHQQAFSNGLQVGYNTLDLIASFMFAPLVLSHFTDGVNMDSVENRRSVFSKMLKASFVAAGLLGAMYIGLTYVAAFHTPYLGGEYAPEERLSAIALHLLGPSGAFVATIAVALACLTTAIPLTAIFAKYLQEELLPNKIGGFTSLAVTLGISAGIANLGFTGIANMLSPVLQVLCPGLIVLSVLNIVHKLFETRVPKLPVFATFAISTASHIL